MIERRGEIYLVASAAGIVLETPNGSMLAGPAREDWKGECWFLALSKSFRNPAPLAYADLLPTTSTPAVSTFRSIYRLFIATSRLERQNG